MKAIIIDSSVFFFFFNDTATTEIYTLSLHDALPILAQPSRRRRAGGLLERAPVQGHPRERRHRGLAALRPLARHRDRKSTRLNSSHANISYAVFCLKKKKNINHTLSYYQ